MPNRPVILLAAMVTFGVMFLSAAGVLAQNYPNKAVRIVTGAPGGGLDFATRILAQGLTEGLGQPVIIENRASILLGEFLRNATPDGYTLVVTGESLWILPLLQKMPYDPLKDLTPVTLAISAPNVLVVVPSLPVKSVKELIDLAKSKPGALSYGSTSLGASAHLGAELFISLTGVKLLHVPYKGTGDLVNAMIGGQGVNLAFLSASNVGPHVKTGRMRALAVTSPKPSPLAPGLPAVAETVPGYEMSGEVVLLAPPGTPGAIINRLNQETVRYLNTAVIKERFLNSGNEVVGTSPEKLSAWIKSEMVRWGKVIKDAGIRIE